MNHSITGHDIEFRHINGFVDGNAAIAKHTYAKVVSVDRFDNSTLQSIPENFSADHMVLENIRKSFRVLEQGLNGGIAELRESLGMKKLMKFVMQGIFKL